MKDETVLLNKALGDNKEAIKLNTREMQASREQEKDIAGEYRSTQNMLSTVIEKMDEGLRENTRVLEKYLSYIPQASKDLSQATKDLREIAGFAGGLKWWIITIGTIMAASAFIATINSIIK